MPNTQSTLGEDRVLAEKNYLLHQRLLEEMATPPIPFAKAKKYKAKKSSTKEKGGTSDDEEDEDEYQRRISYEVPMDPTDPDSKDFSFKVNAATVFGPCSAMDSRTSRGSLSLFGLRKFEPKLLTF